MAQVITNIGRTTETEAVNAMLSAIGESPVTAADTATQADVVMALKLLKDATRELQSKPWRFNFETGLEVAPTTTLSWPDTSGTTTTLNVFKVPAQVSAWRQTVCRQNGDLDLVERLSKRYQESSLNVVVLYDRARNRDGAEASRFPFVYIDAVSTFNFEQMPETARRLATVMAGRRFCQQVVGSAELAGFATGDEALARRIFQEDQNDEEDLNMLNSATAWGILGQRPLSFAGTAVTVRPGHT